MLIKSKRKLRHPDSPQRHRSHNRPMTRRQLIGQGFLAGSATVLSGGIIGTFANPRDAMAQLASDLAGLRLDPCGITDGNGRIPFIAFDLAGGANIAGSNVLAGREGGQLATLGTAGYNRLGLPGDMVPGATEAAPSATGTSNGDHTDTSLGLAFHSDSAFLRGMYASFRTINTLNINGAIIPARSENDTGNNPHNPLYAIAKAGAGGLGAKGSILTLAGSRNSESGGNSLAPMSTIDPSIRPTKVDRPSDVSGLVDTGQLVNLLSKEDATAVLESVYRISASKMDDPQVQTGLTTPVTADEVLKDLVKCGYLKAADIADRFGGASLDPGDDPRIFDALSANGIFNDQDWNGGGADESEFRKTASIMKLVIDGYCGAGCVTVGGYDYHGGMRQEGEVKDFRAGRCMGACLEYAAQVGVPLMIYVFSDGALSSNGVIDDSVNGRGKGEWTSDNQDTAASFFLVYSPNGTPPLFQSGSDGLPAAQHQQIGAFTADGNVMRAGTPGANNVNLLVEMVALNYMALHGQQDDFAAAFPNHGLGNTVNLDRFTAFEQIQFGPVVRT
ncbi:MAG TPA: hypothetical protein VMR74_04340 [Gammaproteobacteria bacterium]|nr:hypothetical protein [Gammaproteobacteria bacterium]